MARCNLQQVPKTKDILDCLVPGEGQVFVELDITSLEPTIQADFSRDETLLDLYASGEEHDIYLYFARFIHPDPAVREVLLQEYRPGKENLAELKAKHKAARSLVKPAFLAMGYGAGAGRIKLTYSEEGFDIPFETCKEIYDNYWSKLQGLRAFEDELKREWQSRRGYILDGFGLPRCVPHELRKDLLNRFVQSTGHEILLRYLVNINKLRKSRGVPMVAVVPDLHDETIFRCKEDVAEECQEGS